MNEYIRKKADKPFILKEIPLQGGLSLPVFQSPLLFEAEGIRHFFTTRDGGVSEGCLGTLNFSFHRGDQPERVTENYRRTAEALGITPDRIVCTDQTHTDHIRVVTEEDAGKGVVRPRDYTDIDGLVTNVPQLALAVFTADCVPTLIYDPVKRAIAAVHSGWRGTAAQIGRRAVETMQKIYGTDPADLLCAVGPSICRDCYEVSPDVAEVFRGIFGGKSDRIVFPKEKHADMGNAAEEKYLIDLWEANRTVLLSAGVPKEQISVTDLCTACNPERLFSHRASHGKRGNMGAFLMLV